MQPSKNAINTSLFEFFFLSNQTVAANATTAVKPATINVTRSRNEKLLKDFLTDM